MKLFNTETRCKESIHTSDTGVPFKIYTCGPTVYDHAHIGNFRTYVVEDLLRRTLKFFGFSLIQVMNITDIDDKTIRGAMRRGISLGAFTEPFIQAFFKDLTLLGIERAEHYPRATEYIPKMIDMIETLLREGFAYVGQEGSIYYNLAKFPRYGRLSHLPLDQLQSKQEERVIADEYQKEHAADFALWKAFDPERDGDFFWDSPFGKGRPGWHIECSAMANSLLGDTVDLHAGGVDNLFPHHENEIAQTEACTKHLFVRHWMHVEHLLVDNHKMSKSLGNCFILKDLLVKGYSGLEIRYLLLQAHYRTPLNFTFESLESAAHSLQRLIDFSLRMHELSMHSQVKETNFQQVVSILEHTLATFAEALADDLNISEALAALFNMVREINSLCDIQGIGKESANKILEGLNKMNGPLGVLDCLEQLEESLHPDIEHLIDLRRKAKDEKDWKKADFYRDEINLKGYLVEDTPQGGIRLKKMRGIRE